MPADNRVAVFRSTPCDLGEGVLWHADRNALFWIDIEGRKIFETQLDSTAVRTFPLAERVGSIVPAGVDRLAAALQSGIFLIDLASGVTTELVRPTGHDAHRVRFNDGKCDSRGRLWVGTTSLRNEAGLGLLYRIDPDRTTNVILSNLSVANGLGWSGDGQTFYHIDTPTQMVRAFDFDVETGAVSRGRVAIDFSQQPGFPDGCTVDCEDCLWIAHWGGARVTRWNPKKGQLLDTLLLPVSNVTSCTFGGAALDRLFISTASHGLEPATRAREQEAGFLFEATVATQGMPACAFSV